MEGDDSTAGPISNQQPADPEERIRRFLHLKTEDEVRRAMADTGVVLMGRPPRPDEWTPEQIADFRKTWGLESEEEAREAIAMAGLITVMHGDLVEAARRAKHPLIVLKAVTSSMAAAEADIRALVPVLRERGHSWTQIGKALGMTKQAAWERFSGEE